MSQYNKPSDIKYARFQILPVDLHFGLFWSTGIPTMYLHIQLNNAPLESLSHSQVHVCIITVLSLGGL